MDWFWGSDGPDLFELLIAIFLFGPLLIGAAILGLSLLSGGAAAAGRHMSSLMTDATPAPPVPPTAPTGEDSRSLAWSSTEPASTSPDHPELRSDGHFRPPERSDTRPRIEMMIEASLTAALETMDVDHLVPARQLRLWVDAAAVAVLSVQQEHASSGLDAEDELLVVAHNVIDQTYDRLAADPDASPSAAYVVPAALACLILQDQASPGARNRMFWGPEIEAEARRHQADGLF